MELHGCKGCGSVVVEALLDMAGQPYTRDVFDWEDKAAWERLKGVNPLAQVPTLVAGLRRKSELLELSRRLVVEPGRGF